MKKVLVLFIALTMIFALISCEETLGPIEQLNQISLFSEPTRVSTDIVEIHGEHTLCANYTLTMGLVDGKNATQYIAVYDKFETVDGGISDIITGPITRGVTETKEYVDGKGVRENGGAWIKGSDFAPEKGALALNIAENLVSDYSYFDNVFAATIPAENTEAVLGVEIPSDVEIEIETNGVVIVSVSMSYAIEADDEYPEISVELVTNYTYDVQEITLVKSSN